MCGRNENVVIFTPDAYVLEPCPVCGCNPKIYCIDRDENVWHIGCENEECNSISRGKSIISKSIMSGIPKWNQYVEDCKRDVENLKFLLYKCNEENKE